MFLRAVHFLDNSGQEDYPFNIAAFRGVKTIPLTHPVTFFIGENGSGKSTLLEAVAANCGFFTGGGSRNNLFEIQPDTGLKEYLRLSWFPKMTEGFFLRAETFYLFSSYVEIIGERRRQNIGGLWGTVAPRPIAW